MDGQSLPVCDTVQVRPKSTENDFKGGIKDHDSKTAWR